MIVNPNPILHTTVNHDRVGTPPEIRRQHEAVMNELARQARQVWDRGAPPPAPLPANPYSSQK